MLYPKAINSSTCGTIPSLIESIDCQLTKLSYALYNNTIYSLNKPIDYEGITTLLFYKRILAYKYCNETYAEHFTVSQIASKVRLLTSGCKTNCLPKIEYSHGTTTTTTTLSPTTTTTTTIHILSCEYNGGSIVVAPTTTTTTSTTGLTTTTTTSLTTTTTTALVGEAVVTLDSITNITSDSALSTITIESLGTGTPSLWGIDYDETGLFIPGSFTRISQSLGSSPIPNTTNNDLLNLSENTQYYVRAFATTSVSTVYSSTLSFYTEYIIPPYGYCGINIAGYNPTQTGRITNCFINSTPVIPYTGNFPIPTLGNTSVFVKYTNLGLKAISVPYNNCSDGAYQILFYRDNVLLDTRTNIGTSGTIIFSNISLNNGVLYDIRLSWHPLP